MDQKQHELKAQPKTFDALKKNRNFDIRKNDRQFAAGDKIIFREWTLPGGYSWRVKFAIIKSITPLSDIPNIGHSDAALWVALGLKFVKK